VIGWGGTYGSIATAVQRARRNGKKIGQVHFRYLNPFPKNTAEVFKRFKRFLVPELNSGQLLLLLRGNFLIDAKGLNKVQGRPFLVSEIEEAIDKMLG
jgi:2-oxoglutarate ferredoxin oxidoreductase subunit alpha